jgi:hypothetical protein
MDPWELGSTLNPLYSIEASSRYNHLQYANNFSFQNWTGLLLFLYRLAMMRKTRRRRVSPKLSIQPAMQKNLFSRWLQKRPGPCSLSNGSLPLFERIFSFRQPFVQIPREASFRVPPERSVPLQGNQVSLTVDLCLILACFFLGHLVRRLGTELKRMDAAFLGQLVLQ